MFYRRSWICCFYYLICSSITSAYFTFSFNLLTFSRILLHLYNVTTLTEANEKKVKAPPRVNPAFIAPPRAVPAFTAPTTTAIPPANNASAPIAHATPRTIPII